MTKTAFWFAILLLAGAVHADTDKPWWQSWVESEASTTSTTRVFSEDEKQIIRSYFREAGLREWSHDSQSGRDKPKKKKSLPPGLRKKLGRGGELPPGWQKKVARGEVLDADLYGQSSPLPVELLERLSTPPEGTETRLLDDRVVRIVNDTLLILDVLSLN
jgi:hypothetical protein